MYVPPNNVYVWNNDAFRAYVHHRLRRLSLATISSRMYIYNLKTFTMKKNQLKLCRQRGSKGDKTIIMILFPSVFNNNHHKI